MKGPLRPFFVASVERQSSLKEQLRNIAVQIVGKKQIAISRTQPVVQQKRERMPSLLTVPKDWQKYCTLYPRKNDLALCSNLSVRHVLGILSCEKF